MRRGILCSLTIVLLAGALSAACYFGGKRGFPRPYRAAVEAGGADPLLVYAVMKAESGFQEDAVSDAGAVGLMQLLPSTAEFICKKRGKVFDPLRLKEGEYNTELGCLYLCYLMERFPERDTALAAYNAGEGTVSEWLNTAEYSENGKTLNKIPYAETRAYLKKIKKFLKIYEFYYR